MLGENFIFDASASAGGLSYEFFVNGISNGIASSRQDNWQCILLKNTLKLH